MIESASIDKESHKRNPCGSIGEIEQLEESLALALSFAAQHPDTRDPRHSGPCSGRADPARAQSLFELSDPYLFAAYGYALRRPRAA